VKRHDDVTPAHGDHHRVPKRQERTHGVSKGDLALLDDPVAQELLRSTNLAKLAYVWTDGTPRVVPIWFEWTGQEIVIGSPPGSPKLKALRVNPHVALTIDSATNQEHVLLIRGTATVEMMPASPPNTPQRRDATQGKGVVTPGSARLARCSR
jgi:hypothetical protein